jgi:hypothetical protein
MVTSISNCEYNVHKQLVKRLQFLYHADRYLKEANTDGHKVCAEMWQKIIANERKNVELLQQAVERDASNR